MSRGRGVSDRGSGNFTPARGGGIFLLPSPGRHVFLKVSKILFALLQGVLRHNIF